MRRRVTVANHRRHGRPTSPAARQRRLPRATPARIPSSRSAPRQRRWPSLRRAGWRRARSARGRSEMAVAISSRMTRTSWNCAANRRHDGHRFLGRELVAADGVPAAVVPRPSLNPSCASLSRAERTSATDCRYDDTRILCFARMRSARSAPLKRERRLPRMLLVGRVTDPLRRRVRSSAGATCTACTSSSSTSPTVTKLTPADRKKLTDGAAVTKSLDGDPAKRRLSSVPSGWMRRSHAMSRR